MEKRKRFISTILVLVLAGMASWFIYGKIRKALDEPEAQRSGRVVAVEAAAVEFGPTRDIRRFTGTIRARSEFEVAPRMAARIEYLAVDIGDTVRPGELLARLDDEEFVQEMEQARAELDVAKATLAEKQSDLDIAQRELHRVELLHEQRIASESELDSARSNRQARQAALHVAEAQVAQREAALRRAQVRLSYATIRAVWEGSGQSRVVGERFVDEGATVSANTPFFSLLDIETVLALIYVTESEYVRLRLGQEARLEMASPSMPYQGEIIRMAPLFQEGSRQARVEIAVPNPDGHLKPGMFVRVSIELDRAENATIIPRQSLVRRNGRQGVFMVDDSESETLARFVPVRLGIQERDRVQVLEPELSGRVVVLGQHLLSDETRIQVVEEKADQLTASRQFFAAEAQP